MAFETYPPRRPTPALALTLSWKGQARTWKMGRTAARAIVVVLPILGIWSAVATGYFVFHDQLLASLISRQADLQYSYEDRIAVLRSQLERQTSLALVDRRTLSTTLRDLASRGERLEAHAAAIDALVHGVGSGTILSKAAGRDEAARLDAPLSTPETTHGDVGANDPAASSSALRLDQSDDRGNPNDEEPRIDKRVELLPEQQEGNLATTFANIEAHQAKTLADLRYPMMRAIERIETALAGTGLPASRWKTRSRSEGIGGPFVPLPAEATAMTFEQNLDLLQGVLAQHTKLAELVGRIPLRQPLPGRLEVTSPFGARLDPFYGRAAMHTGMDLMGAYGDSVRATAGGVVTVAGSDGGYGQMVEIDHGNGLVTRYAHLSSIDVSVRERVAIGTIVGRIGSSGRATGPHLHYETRIDGDPVDPARFLKAGAVLSQK